MIRLEEERREFYGEEGIHDESNEELDKDSDDESDEEVDEEVDEEENEEENEIDLENLQADIKKGMASETDEKLSNLCTSEETIDTPKQATTSETTNIEEINAAIQSENTEANVNKDIKINGKFEVSIIKENAEKEVSNESNLSVESSSSTSQSTQFVKQNLQKTLSNPDSEVTSLECNVHPEKSKGSSRRVSFAEPHFVEIVSDSHKDNKQNNEENVSNESDSDDIININFIHSDIKPSVCEKNTENNIINPGDIYRIFYKPKSILKKSPDSEYNDKNISFADHTVMNEKNSQHTAIDSTAKSTYNVVSIICIH
jgi:hypothetical protein